MAVTTPELAPTRPKRNLTIIVVAAIGVIALVAAAVAITLTVTKNGQAAKPTVPVIDNIPQPNPACTPAADRKLGLGDDLSKIYWVGWLDGKQADMPVGQALSQRIAGHDVRDVWYCPPRADW